MKTVSFREARDKLSRYIDEVSREHEIVRITRHGKSAAVLISEDDLDSLRETLHLLSTPGAAEELAQAEHDFAAGRGVAGDELRQRFGVDTE